MNPLLAYILKPLCENPGVGSVLLAGDDGALVGWLLDAPGADRRLLHVASPRFGFDTGAMRAHGGDRLLLHPSRAADALALMPLPDLLIIDGEPNWYAVSSTLRAASRTGAPFPLTLVTDTAWPYARRDRYTDPGAMPAAFVRLHEKAGVSPGQAGLTAGAGLFTDRFHATTENEPGNGVLTAVEAFLLEQDGRLGMVSLPMLHGVSLIYDRTLPLAEHVRVAIEAMQLGVAARAAAVATERARVELMAETARLRQAVQSAEYGFAAARAALEEERAAWRRQEETRALRADPRRLARQIPAVLRRAAGKARSLAGVAQGGGQDADALPSGNDEAQIERLRRSPILDGAWYAERYGDVGADTDPAVHYYRHGAAEGRDPGPAFSTRFYLEANPDVAAAGHNPLLHYLAGGALEGRDPGPHFSSAFYLQSNPDVAEAGHNPLEHFLVNGQRENRRPLPAVS